MVSQKNKCHVIVNTIVEFILCDVYFYNIHNFLRMKNVNNRLFIRRVHGPHSDYF